MAGDMRAVTPRHINSRKNHEDKLISRYQKNNQDSIATAGIGKQIQSLRQELQVDLSNRPTTSVVRPTKPRPPTQGAARNTPRVRTALPGSTRGFPLVGRTFGDKKNVSKADDEDSVDTEQFVTSCPDTIKELHSLMLAKIQQYKAASSQSFKVDKALLDWHNEVDWLLRHHSEVLSECQGLREKFSKMISLEKEVQGSLTSGEEEVFNLIKNDTFSSLLLVMDLIPQALPELGVTVNSDPTDSMDENYTNFKGEAHDYMQMFKWDHNDREYGLKAIFLLLKLRGNLLTRLNTHVASMFIPYGLVPNGSKEILEVLPFAMHKLDREDMTPLCRSYFQLLEMCFRFLLLLKHIHLPVDFASFGEKLAKTLEEKRFLVNRLSEMERRQYTLLAEKDERIRELENKLFQMEHPEVYFHLTPTQQLLIDVHKWKHLYQVTKDKLIKVQTTMWKSVSENKQLLLQVQAWEREQFKGQCRLMEMEARVTKNMSDSVVRVEGLEKSVGVLASFNHQSSQEATLQIQKMASMVKEVNTLKNKLQFLSESNDERSNADSATILNLRKSTAELQQERTEMRAQTAVLMADKNALTTKLDDTTKAFAQVQNEFHEMRTTFRTKLMDSETTLTDARESMQEKGLQIEHLEAYIERIEREGKDRMTSAIERITTEKDEALIAMQAECSAKMLEIENRYGGTNVQNLVSGLLKAKQTLEKDADEAGERDQAQQATIAALKKKLKTSEEELALYKG